MQELERLVVRFPESTYYYNEPLYLPLVRVDGRDGVIFVAEEGDSARNGIDLSLPYQVIASVTRRAMMLIDGCLSVPGRPKLTPQQYIQDWRKALAAAITPEELTQTTGSTIVFSGTLDLTFEAGAERGRPDWGPKMTLREILAELGTPPMDPGVGNESQTRHEVQISSLKEGGAAMAMALQWLSRYERGDPRMASFSTCLVQATGAAQQRARAQAALASAGLAGQQETSAAQIALF